ncbi:hypothetical protein M3212_07705 [Alkalihalobacillus oceani]|uniref:hypothetical protein n=1 Tax=Halalkalibacter oceani TaxID=1653776 RepID=UPI00203B3270|nr:hypothetical protein [Halalkalibacter oceani]MCM3760671.1 hypothetical protein [Halalkalibacter oceani]
MSVMKMLYLQTETLFSFVNEPFRKKQVAREALLTELKRSGVEAGAELIKLNKRLMYQLEQPIYKRKYENRSKTPAQTASSSINVECKNRIPRPGVGMGILFETGAEPPAGF